MAERLLAHALAAEEAPVKALRVSSAGVSAYPGDKASINSVYALRKVGIELEDHRSQPVTQELLNETLALFAMTKTHIDLVGSRFAYLPPHVHLMRKFIPSEAPREIPDPYGASLESYEECRDSMVEAVPSIVKFLKSIV